MLIAYCYCVLIVSVNLVGSVCLLYALIEFVSLL